MKYHLKKTITFLACLAGLTLATTVNAEDFYVAQNALGAGNGSSAANAYGVTFFNTSSNWATGAGKISAGDTVHLVGTISTTLTVQGSGASGSPTTILFEPGAKLSRPYWGVNAASAIYVSGKSYIVIDGDSTGVIECTDNGDTLANNQPAYGVTITGGTDNTVQGLTVRNLYTHTYGVDNKIGTYTTRCIYVENCNNFAVRNCTLNNAYLGVYALANGRTVTNNIVERNNISACSTAVVFACGGLTSDNITGFVMRYNDITMGGNWYDVPDMNHIDGIHTWTSAGKMSGLSIHGNYFHGDSSKNCTSQIYLSDNLSSCYIYNNFITSSVSKPAQGYINLNLTGTADAYIFNNTIVGLGTSSSGGIGLSADPSRAGTTIHLKNNIITNCYVAIYDGLGAATWDSDYNSVSNCGNFAYKSAFVSLLTLWQTLTGGDSHTVTTSPNLTATYFVPTAVSAIGKGTDLTAIGNSLGVNFAVDIAGSPRTTWDLGMVKAGTSSWNVGVNSGPIKLPPTNALVLISVL